MRRTYRLSLAAGIALWATAAAQERQTDDVVQLKGDRAQLLVGKITAVTEKGIEMTLKEGGKIAVSFQDIVPYSVYKIKAERIDPQNAAAHMELAEFCAQHGLYSQAAIELDKAKAIDKSLDEKVEKRKAQIRDEEARSRFEEAKKLGAQKKYRDALELLKLIVDRFTDTPYFEEAKKEMSKLADEVRLENERRAAELTEKERKKREEAAKKEETAERAQMAQAADLIKEAQAQWREGLDHETRHNITKSDRAWKLSEDRLLRAQVIVDRLKNSNDVNTINQAKEVEKEITSWLVRTYYRLGRLWAVELNYIEAMPWLNKGLKLAPDDHLLNEIQLTLTQIQMRKRAASQGY
ncbi:MAG: hypothetical protein HY716_07680 [Planctomycetes bacterium]|nr:hypothetical protein [Planctomycetota bacterium]